jgi:hypothetical protein
VPLVNSLHCKLDYLVDAKSASNASVEVWGTPDSGKQWLKIGESPQGQSPVAVTFPSDGLWGFLFVVKALMGNNLPPQSGDTPDSWVEVDTTKPIVELQSVKPGNGEEAGDLFINWSATDRNLGADPVAIYYAIQPTGPWNPIALGLPNSGHYRWPLPRGLARIYVRLEVTDRAGNSTRCETPQPVRLGIPRVPVKLLNISPITEGEK